MQAHEIDGFEELLDNAESETKLATLGDTVICRCKLPVPYNIIMRLDTYMAVSEVNKELIKDEPIWELLK